MHVTATTLTIQAELSHLALIPTQTRSNLARLHVSMLALVWPAPNFQRTFTLSVKVDFNRLNFFFSSF
jgi:hypothetical protein